MSLDDANIVDRLSKRFSQFSGVWIEVDENEVALVIDQGMYSSQGFRWVCKRVSCILEEGDY